MFRGLNWALNAKKPDNNEDVKTFSENIKQQTFSTHPNDLLRESVLRIATTFSSFFNGEVKTPPEDDISRKALISELESYKSSPYKSESPDKNENRVAFKISELGVKSLSYKKAVIQLEALLKTVETEITEIGLEKRQEKLRNEIVTLNTDTDSNPVDNLKTVSKENLEKLHMFHFLFTTLEKVPNDPIDFGQVTELTEDEVKGLAQMLYGIGAKNTKQVVMALESVTTNRPEAIKSLEIFESLERVIQTNRTPAERLIESIKIVLREGIELRDGFLPYALKGLITLAKENFVEPEQFANLLTKEVTNYLMTNMSAAIEAQVQEAQFKPEESFSKTSMTCNGLLKSF